MRAYEGIMCILVDGYVLLKAILKIDLLIWVTTAAADLESLVQFFYLYFFFIESE